MFTCKKLIKNILKVIKQTPVILLFPGENTNELHLGQVVKILPNICYCKRYPPRCFVIINNTFMLLNSCSLIRCKIGQITF